MEHQTHNIDKIIKQYLETLSGFYGFKTTEKFKTKYPIVVKSFEKIKTDKLIKNDEMRELALNTYFTLVRDLCFDIY